MSDLDEEQAIRKTINGYIDAIKLTQPERMKEVFHPDATISREKPDGFLISANPGDAIANYMRSVPPTVETSPDFAGEIRSIDRAGDIAAVRIVEKKLEGRDFNTFFLLHKVDGRWLITSKATQSVPSSG